VLLNLGSGGSRLPIGGQQRSEVVSVGKRGQATEEHAHVGVWFLTLGDEGGDNEVEHGHALACFGFPRNSQLPLLSAKRRMAFPVQFMSKKELSLLIDATPNLREFRSLSGKRFIPNYSRL
jgi:hypothetical protein